MPQGPGVPQPGGRGTMVGMTAPRNLPHLDRRPSPPSESARYPMRALVRTTVERRERHWSLTGDFPLDQGDEGACVGFGTSAELSAEPVAVPTGNVYANRLYALAQAEDRAMGQYFDDGASVLGGMRAARKQGVVASYLWAESIDDIRDAVITHGSVVMGTNWHAGMDEPRADGFIRAAGEVRGGHCYALIGYVPDHPTWGEVFEGVNSWGPSWGDRGRFLIPVSDVAELLAADGEAAIVTDVPVAVVPVPAPTPQPAARPWPRIPQWFRSWLASIGIVER